MEFAGVGVNTNIKSYPISVNLTKGFNEARNHAVRLYGRFPVLGLKSSLQHDKYAKFIGEQNSTGSVSDYYVRKTVFRVTLPNIPLTMKNQKARLSNSFSLTDSFTTSKNANALSVPSKRSALAVLHCQTP